MCVCVCVVIHLLRHLLSLRARPWIMIRALARRQVPPEALQESQSELRQRNFCAAAAATLEWPPPAARGSLKYTNRKILYSVFFLRSSSSSSGVCVLTYILYTFFVFPTRAKYDLIVNRKKKVWLAVDLFYLKKKKTPIIIIVPISIKRKKFNKRNLASRIIKSPPKRN